MRTQDHPDSRGVFVELWTIDLLDGDLTAALLLSQLLWWHQPGKDGKPRVTHERDGHRWLLRADDDWQQDCRLTTKQVRRVRSVLVNLGLVEHRRFKLNGAPTSAWRPLYEAIQEAIRPDSELPSEGQFQGSDPQGAVPIPSPPLVTSVSASKVRRSSFPDVFRLTDEMRAWAAENVSGVDVIRETRKFADYYRARGDRMVRWDLAWRNWLRNAEDRRRPPPSNGTVRSPDPTPAYVPSIGASATCSPEDYERLYGDRQEG